MRITLVDSAFSPVSAKLTAFLLMVLMVDLAARFLARRLSDWRWRLMPEGFLADFFCAMLLPKLAFLCYKAVAAKSKPSPSLTYGRRLANRHSNLVETQSNFTYPLAPLVENRSW